MRFGVAYQGGKNQIAEWIIDNLPEDEILVDLFAGGCAVTHAAMLSGKWNKVIANDIGDAPELFCDAIDGKYADEKRWISREDFQNLKDTDPYVSICWSFGNNRTGYLYAQEIEPWKKALHYARVFGDCSLLREMGIDSDGSSDDVLKHHDEYKEKYIRWWLSKQKYTSAELDKLIANVKADIERDEEELRQYLIDALKKSGLTQAEVQRRLGTQMASHYFGRSQWEFPTQEMYEKMQEFMPLPDDYNELVGLYRLRQSLQSLQSLQRLQSLQSLQSLERLQSLQRLESLERLQRLQRLERLQRLQRLQSPESLEKYKNNLAVTRKSYSDVAVPDNAVVYADPPYKGTCQDGYKCEFDYDTFEKWLNEVPFMVIVSEYNAPAGCIEIASIKKQSLFGAGNKGVTNTEKLFVQERFYNEYLQKMGRLF